MSDLENEIPLEFYSDGTDDADLLEVSYADYITEELGVAAQRTIGLVEHSSTKLRKAFEKTKIASFMGVTSLKETINGKGYMDIKDILVPTMPGFTGTYHELSKCLQDHANLINSVLHSTLLPTLHYLEHLATDNNLMLSRAPIKDVRDYKIVKYDIIRDDISSHFTRHDTSIMLPYGMVFRNISEHDAIKKSLGDLYQACTNSRTINNVTNTVDRIDVICKKIYLKYFTDDKQLVSKEVRKQVASLIRECAIASETLAFYVHIVTLAKASFVNIEKHIKSKK